MIILVMMVMIVIDVNNCETEKCSNDPCSSFSTMNFLRHTSLHGNHAVHESLSLAMWCKECKAVEA